MLIGGFLIGLIYAAGVVGIIGVVRNNNKVVYAMGTLIILIYIASIIMYSK